MLLSGPKRRSLFPRRKRLSAPPLLLLVVVAVGILAVATASSAPPSASFVHHSVGRRRCSSEARNSLPFGGGVSFRRGRYAETPESTRKTSALRAAGPPGGEEDDSSPPSGPPEGNWLQSLKQQASSSDLGPVVDDNDDDDDDLRSDDVAVPTTGVSVSDALVESTREKFVTELVPVKGVPGAAIISTESTSGGGDEPARYLVALSPPPPEEDEDEEGKKDEEKASSSRPRLPRRYALIDVPPYSDSLVDQIKSFMGGPNSSLCAVLVTNRDSVHYDESPAVYVTRKSDATAWRAAFPDAKFVAYRMDVPRDCRDLFDQKIDGEGPWALEEEEENEDDDGGTASNATFVETGRPLTYEEWDEETARRVLDGGDLPDEEKDDGEPADADLYTPQKIREREDGRRILAVYTPGRTFGSVSYVFPETGVCCSGFAIPVEDKRSEENLGRTGPNLDYRGYVTTNAAGIGRQTDAARRLVGAYVDRFRAVLPARGDPILLGGNEEERKRLLDDVLDQYEKIGKIYEKLGITS